jgi:hypothetical protein
MQRCCQGYPAVGLQFRGLKFRAVVWKGAVAEGYGGKNIYQGH